MPWGFAAAAVGTIASSAIKAKGARDASKAQVAAADKAAALEKEMFDKQVELQEPFRQAGITNLNELQRRLGLAGDASSAGYGSLVKNFGMEDFQQDPGYGFRMSEGLKALDRQAAARGGLISGAALKAAQGYGQNLASEEYQNAFNRYQTNRGSIYGMLSGQQGVGQTATNQLGAGARNYAAQAGEDYIGAGNARASGYLGQASAYASGLNSLSRMGGNYFDSGKLFGNG